MDEEDVVIGGFFCCIIAIVLIVFIGCDDDKDEKTAQVEEAKAPIEVTLETVYDQNNYIINTLNSLPAASSENAQIAELRTYIDSALTEISLRQVDAPAPYVTGSDKGVFTEGDSTVKKLDDMAVVEFEYKGRKYARFSLEGAGRGFAIPLDCGSPESIKDSTGAPVSTPKTQYNFNFSN